MAFSITSSYCTPPAATVAAAHKRLPGAARLLLLGSGATSGGRVAVAAVLPAVGCARVGSLALTRCTAGDQAEPTPEPLMLVTLDTLREELLYWLANPPRSRENFNKIEITTGKCMDLHKRMIEIVVHLPGDILKGIANIEKIDTTFVKLHNQSRGENPWTDANTIEVATDGLTQLAQIFLQRCKQIKYQASPTSEPLTAATFTTLANKLRYWLTNPPKCKEDFKKIDIIVGKCMDLFPRMVHDLSIVPAAGIIKEIADIIVSIFLKLRIQISGEDPRADANAIDAAIKGIERMAKIFDEGGPGLMG